jgi:hypothetical protein
MLITFVQPSRSSAPSPVPTEIIPLELTQEEIVEENKKMGIQVRDFANEDMPTSQRAIELFDPLRAWHTYETAFTYPVMTRIAFPGKITRRLLDIGWIKREEEEEQWSDKDREALEEYDKRSQYPWCTFKVPKPNLESLSEAWRTRYQELTDKPPPPRSRFFSLRFRASKVGGMADKKRDVSYEQGTQNGDVPPQTKKRRLEDQATECSEPLSNQALVLIGRPPQQFPAGNPAGAQQSSANIILNMYSLAAATSRTK